MYGPSKLVQQTAQSLITLFKLLLLLQRQRRPMCYLRGCNHKNNTTDLRHRKGLCVKNLQCPDLTFLGCGMSSAVPTQVPTSCCICSD
jgi:hypothetical protein